MTARRHPATQTDRQLLQEARGGRGESFELVYRRHCRVVLAFVAQRTNEPELAADLMAETFAELLVLVRDPERPLPPILIAWLLVTARHLLIDAYRRGQVEDAARRRLAMQPLELDDRDLERVEETATETNLLEDLAALLTPEQVVSLRARVLDDRDYPDIADELRCSQSVVRKRVSRALRVLRRSLEETNHA